MPTTPDDMATVRREAGRLLAERRRAAGLSQATLARRIGYERSTVATAETGHRFPAEDFWRRCDDVLAVGNTLLAMFQRMTAARLREVHERKSRDEQRREASLSQWRQANAIPPIDPQFGQVPQLDARERVDDQQLEHVIAYMHHLIDMDNTLGSAGLAPLAIAQFRRLRWRFEDPTLGRGRRREVAAVLCELAEVAGWLAFDDADQETTRRMNQESLYYSDLVGEKRVKTLTLQNSSMQAGFLGRPREALAIADSVLDGPGRLSPRLRSLFLVRRARALAQGGDWSARRVFDEARSLYLDGVADRDPAWTWWVDDRELSWHEAMILTDLGDLAAALERFEYSVSVVPPGMTRSRYSHLAHLLGAQVAAEAWSETDHTIDQLLPLVRDVASRRTHLLLSRLTPPAVALAPPGVKDSFEQLTRTLDVLHDE